MKTKKIILGCGIAALIALLGAFMAVYFGGAALFRYGVGSDLSDYRDAIQKIDIDADTRAHLIADLEEIRLSLDERNGFSFFQWLEIDNSIQGVIADGKLDGDEYASLNADIQRMRRTQGLDTTKNVEQENAPDKK